MRRKCAIALLLVLTMASSSPVWALSLSDHSCCAPQAPAKAASPASQSGKHAHCAHMAAAAAAAMTTVPPSAQISALHSCKTCMLATMQTPRNVAIVTAHSAVGFSTTGATATVELSTRSQLIIFNRDERGPPPLFL